MQAMERSVQDLTSSTTRWPLNTGPPPGTATCTSVSSHGVVFCKDNVLLKDGTKYLLLHTVMLRTNPSTPKLRN